MTVDIAGAPSPKFATRRDPDARTLGTLQGRFAQVWLSHGLMPWQQYVADVAGELTPAGRPRYKLVVVTVPRQAGKSHLAMARVGERMMSVPNFRAWYTAQTGQDAADQFLKFADDVVAGTPLDRVMRTLRGNGRQVMRSPNGSSLRPHPPTEKALHGKQSDLSDIDEGWAFPDYHGNQLLQAIAPTQLTRPMSQVCIWSAGGTAESTWLAELVARGRAGDPNMAYFEWGIPDDLDVTDLEAVASHHPAIGHTMDLDAMRALRTLLTDDAEFARAAGNRWTEVIGGAIPADQWRDAQTSLEMPLGVTGWGVSRAADGSHVAVAAATELETGDVLVELVAELPAHGAAGAVAQLVGSDTLAVCRAGASAGLADSLGLLTGVRLESITSQTESAACQNVADALEARAWKVRPHKALDDARQVIGKRRTTGGGFVWANTGEGSIAALEAATWSTHALRHRRPAVGKPVDRWAS